MTYDIDKAAAAHDAACEARAQFARGGAFNPHMMIPFTPPDMSGLAEQMQRISEQIVQAFALTAEQMRVAAEVSALGPLTGTRAITYGEMLHKPKHHLIGFDDWDIQP